VYPNTLALKNLLDFIHLMWVVNQDVKDIQKSIIRNIPIQKVQILENFAFNFYVNFLYLLGCKKVLKNENNSRNEIQSAFDTYTVVSFWSIQIVVLWNWDYHKIWTKQKFIKIVNNTKRLWVIKWQRNKRIPKEMFGQLSYW
jgi:hypothetical protein